MQHEHILVKIKRPIVADNPNFDHSRQFYFIIQKCTVEGCKYERKLDLVKDDGREAD